MLTEANYDTGDTDDTVPFDVALKEALKKIEEAILYGVNAMQDVFEEIEKICSEIVSIKDPEYEKAPRSVRFLSKNTGINVIERRYIPP